MAVAWSQAQDNFVAHKIFPVVPVLKESDLYAIYDEGYFYRDELAPRPLGGRPPRAGYEIKNARYQCIEWGLEDVIDDRIRVNADQPLDPDLAAMRLLTGQALVHRDSLWMKAYFTTGVWGSDYTGVSSGPTGNQVLQFDQAGS